MPCVIKNLRLAASRTIGSEEEKKQHMSLPGRFILQQFLKEMKDEGCKYDTRGVMIHEGGPDFSRNFLMGQKSKRYVSKVYFLLPHTKKASVKHPQCRLSQGTGASRQTHPSPPAKITWQASNFLAMLVTRFPVHWLLSPYPFNFTRRMHS